MATSKQATQETSMLWGSLRQLLPSLGLSGQLLTSSGFPGQHLSSSEALWQLPSYGAHPETSKLWDSLSQPLPISGVPLLNFFQAMVLH